MRSLETNNEKWVRGTIIPCSSGIQRCASIVECYARQKCPYEHGYLESGGEYVKFNARDVVQHAIVSFGLDVAAKQRSVSFSQSFDDAQLTKKLSHTTYGIKVTNKQAVSPFTGQPIFANANSSTLQSRNHNLPIMIVMRNETKEVVDCFEECIRSVTDLGRDARVLSDKYKPLKLAFNSDMSAGWKIRGIGGAAKRETHPCHCCAITSDNLAVPNHELCLRFCKELHSDQSELWRCYHREFLSAEYTSMLEDELNETTLAIGNLLPEMDHLLKESIIHTSEDPRYSKETSINDSFSIHFEYDSENVTREERRFYSERIGKDLVFRHLGVDGNLAVRCERLRVSLETEYKYQQLYEALQHGRKSEAHAIVKLHETVPCILHMENRIGLKIATMLLIEGLQNALKGNTFGAFQAEGGRMRAFIAAIEDACNKQIWGTYDSPTQWQCPRDETKKEIGVLCLDNMKTRRLMNNLEILLPLCLVESDDSNLRLSVWKECIPLYIESIRMVRSKEDMTQQQILEFQKSSDLFFQMWVQLHGREGITNYVHMLGSGHIYEYLTYWGNLYSHSQQGWEAFNSLVKTYYFRRTGRGGAGNRGRGQKSRVIPIARWLSRRMMWMCSTLFDEMKLVHNQTVQVETETDAEEDICVGPVLDNNHVS